ncbi:MAG: acyl-ACP--UDP-N-acetylglucosamine O-acyltransferase [Acidobacteriota bacterium]
MTCEIHPTAQVSPQAELGDRVQIGPFSVIGDEVSIGEETWVGPHTVIEGPTRIGKRNRIYGHSSLGTDPQDLKFQGERTTLLIGDDNKIREFVTLNRGTRGGIGRTVIGSRNLLMTAVHVAHDCEVHNDVILANSATLAGHIVIGDFATVGAFTGVHQFCRVGVHAFIGGYSVLTRDALPFIKTVGVRREARIYGINTLGLKRREFSAARIAALKSAYRVFFMKGFKVGEAIRRIRAQGLLSEDVETLVAFIETARRGFVRSLSEVEVEKAEAVL